MMRALTGYIVGLPQQFFNPLNALCLLAGAPWAGFNHWGWGKLRPNCPAQLDRVRPNFGVNVPGTGEK